MKYKWEIMTLILASVVLVLSVSQLFLSDYNDKANEIAIDSKEIIMESIMSRSSVRNYTDERVSDDLVERMLRAGMAAPTAGNGQPWEFYVVRDTNTIKQFSSVTKYAAPMNEIAQLAIVVCGVPSQSFPVEPRYWVQDVSAATENILLAAHALDLGAVWCGVYPGEDRVATLRSLLDVPDNLVPFSIIMIGHPKGPQKVKDKWKPSKVHYVN